MSLLGSADNLKVTVFYLEHSQIHCKLSTKCVDGGKTRGDNRLHDVTLGFGSV